MLAGKYLWHVLGQLIPDGELTTVPWPVTPTVRMGWPTQNAIETLVDSVDNVAQSPASMAAPTAPHFHVAVQK